MSVPVRTLGSVCDVIAGQHIPAEEHNTSGRGTPYLTGPADFGVTTPSISKWTDSPRQFARASDVLVTVKGAGVGKSNYALDAAIGRQIMALRPNPNLLERRYLFHWIRTNEGKLNRLAKGATVPGIGKPDLENLPVPLPALPAQRRIADILDKADAIRRKRKEAIALSEDLLRAAFLDMFGDPVVNPQDWPKSSVSELCESKQYGTAEKANLEGRGMPVLRMNNLTYTGEIDTNELKWVELPERETAKLDLRDGDVLFNRVNSHELVGKTAAWHGGAGFTFAGYLIRLRFSKNVVSGDYVAAAMNMPSMKLRLMTMAKPSINMANISGSDLDRLHIPVPSLILQRRYEQLKQRVDKLRRDNTTASVRDDEMFASLVQQSFGGIS